MCGGKHTVFGEKRELCRDMIPHPVLSCPSQGQLL